MPCVGVELGDADMTMVGGVGLDNSIGTVMTRGLGLTGGWGGWKQAQVGVDRERNKKFSFDDTASELPQKSREGCRPRKAIRFGD